ncbi:MAG TPA: tetratricopeptide repeat protein [Vicinamibacteria bacterium]|nr:tetratricopeptide repeat protein [Vicinamibacteria bacterium]
MNINLAGLVFALGSAGAFAADLPSGPVAACDPAHVDPQSWRLVTRAQALNVHQPRYSWWDGFNLGKHSATLDDFNISSTRIAERALELDPNNAMAWSQLARLYLIDEDAEAAERAWTRALDAGLPIVWTTTVHNVDARTFHVMAFDRAGIRIYRLDQLGGPVERQFYGLPRFPPAENDRFWMGLGGCLDHAGSPEAAVPWSQEREIKGGNWVLWFKLTRPIKVSSDRTQKVKTIDEIKANMHGRTGELEVYKPVGQDELGMRGRGPWAYNEIIRRTMVKFVDPERRISLPPSKPGVGW